ncbi:MAG: hypothetical protein JWM11_1401 [Planctomycetaceae bacterium]|nr:hypothetical protein [Planctomycetaceae bacterium]
MPLAKPATLHGIGYANSQTQGDAPVGRGALG